MSDTMMEDIAIDRSLADRALGEKREDAMFSVELDRTQLLKLLGRCQHVVERKNAVPVLSHLLLETQAESLRVTASDMDIMVSETIPAVVHASGRIAVPAHLLHDIIRKFPSHKPVMMEWDGARMTLTIVSDHCHFTLPTMEADLFPVMTEDAATYEFSLSASVLRRALQHSYFAASHEEARYYLAGVCVHRGFDQNGESALVFVATDGHRLQRFTLPMAVDAEFPSLIFPLKTVTTLVALLEPEGEGLVRLMLSPTRVRLETAQTQLLSKLVDAIYPDYSAVMPDHDERPVMTVSRVALTEAVDRIAIVASEKTRGIRFCCQNDQLIVDAAGNKSGTGQEDLAVMYGGPAVELSLSARYVLEALGSFQEAELAVHWGDGKQPVIVSPLGTMDAMGVIMPMGID